MLEQQVFPSAAQPWVVAGFLRLLALLAFWPASSEAWDVRAQGPSRDLSIVSALEVTPDGTVRGIQDTQALKTAELIRGKRQGSDLHWSHTENSRTSHPVQNIEPQAVSGGNSGKHVHGGFDSLELGLAEVTHRNATQDGSQSKQEVAWHVPCAIAVICGVVLIAALVVLRGGKGGDVQEAESEIPVGTITSVWHMLCLTSLNAAYGFMLSNLSLLMTPMEVHRLYPEHPALGVSMVCCIFSVANPAGPIIGKASDSFRHTWGRRRPFIAILVLVSVVSTAGLWLFSIFYMRIAAALCTLVQQVVWNGINATQSALLADVVDPAHDSLASGCQTACLLFGAGSGTFAFYVLNHQGQDWHLNYLLVMILSVVLTPIVTVAAPEVSSVSLALPPRLDFSSPRGVFVATYGWDWRRYPDWTILTIERCFYYGTVVCKPFFLNYIEDGIGIANEQERVDLLAKIVITGEVVAGLSAMLSSVATDSYGVKKQTVGSTGAWIMAVGSTLYGSCGFITNSKMKVAALYFAVAVFGVGQGIYLAADFAVALATMPDAKEASRYLGLWGLSLLVGGAVSSVIITILMEGFGRVLAQSRWIGHHVPEGHYDMLGYAAMLVYCSLLCCVCAVALLRVRTREEWGEEAFEGKVAFTKADDSKQQEPSELLEESGVAPD